MLWILYESLRKMNCKTIFLVNTTTTDPLQFRKNLLKRIWKLIITTGDEIIDGNLQYDIKREAAKISAFFSGKINKYEYLTGEEILPPYQSSMIEGTKFTYSRLGKL